MSGLLMDREKREQADRLGDAQGEPRRLREDLPGMR